MMNKKWPVLVLTGVLAGTLMIPAMAADASPSVTPAPTATQEVTALPSSVLYYGTITSIVRDEAGNARQLWMSSDSHGEYVMNLSDQTVWIDCGNHSKDDPSDLEEGESLYVFHSAAATMSLPPQSAAIAVVRNIPADMGSAQYHLVEAVTLEDGVLTITTDHGGLLIFGDSETTLSRYDSAAPITLADLQAGDRIMAWYPAVMESYPAQAHASHLMLLPDEAEQTPEETGDLTRAELMSMLHKAVGKPVVNYAMQYGDVSQDTDYAEAVRWATSEGIVNGCQGGEFRPDDPITREQLAVILYRYAQTQGQGFTGAWAFPLDYEDAASISDYAYEAMCWMTMKGLLSEVSDHQIAPGATVTTQEGTEIIAHLMEVLKA